MADALCGRAEVGKFYKVPCVRLIVSSGLDQHPAAGHEGWIPVIGPEHHDREHINFQPMHLHIDVRFVSAAVLRRYGYGDEADSARRLMGHPVSTFSDSIARSGARIPFDGKVERSTRYLRCRREMPDFPVANARRFIPKLEVAHAGCKLKPGNICPHRGIDLTPFIKEDGTVICPGHGLRWDTKTGDLLPYQATA